MISKLKVFWFNVLSNTANYILYICEGLHKVFKHTWKILLYICKGLYEIGHYILAGLATGIIWLSVIFLEHFVKLMLLILVLLMFILVDTAMDIESILREEYHNNNEGNLIQTSSIHKQARTGE